jgi:hypothetical protein
MTPFSVDSGGRCCTSAEPAALGYLLFKVAGRTTLTPSASLAFEWMARWLPGTATFAREREEGGR